MLDIMFIDLDTDEVSLQFFRHGTRRTRAKEWVQHHVARVGRSKQDAIKQRFRFLGGVKLPAPFLEALAALTNGEVPIRTHLQVFIECFHRVIVEGVLSAHGLLRPNERLMCIAETHPAEVRHGVGLDPYDVVQDPEAQILQDVSNAEDIVISADHPKRTRGLEHPPAGVEPLLSKGVISLQAFKFIPALLDAGYAGDVGPPKV